MKPGHGKIKGGAFERLVCKQLSLWITAGKRTDCFWRSAMSGGRSTRARQSIVPVLVRQAGDVCAVAPEGIDFVKRWYVECKCVADLRLVQWLINGQGPLVRYWVAACDEAMRYERMPMLIAKQNLLPALVLVRAEQAPAEGYCFMNKQVVAYQFDVMLEQPPEQWT